MIAINSIYQGLSYRQADVVWLGWFPGPQVSGSGTVLGRSLVSQE